MIPLNLTLEQFEALYELLNTIVTDDPWNKPLVEILDQLNDLGE